MRSEQLHWQIFAFAIGNVPLELPLCGELCHLSRIVTMFVEGFFSQKCKNTLMV